VCDGPGRHEVADCCQAAYTTLTLSAAAQIMFFPSVEAFLALAATVRLLACARVLVRECSFVFLFDRILVPMLGCVLV
jgi:hypothetical protein